MALSIDSGSMKGNFSSDTYLQGEHKIAQWLEKSKQ